MGIRRKFASISILWSCLTWATAACTSEPAGLDSSQLAARWETTLATSPSTMSVPVSSTEPPGGEESSEQIVTRAFAALMDRRIRCGRSPQTCEIERLAAVASPVFDQLTKLMASRISAGITASTRGRLQYRIESVAVPSLGRAVVTTCLHDDTVLVTDSAIFDDSVYSARSEWTLIESKGEWLWSDERVLEWVVEGNLCIDE